MRAEWDWVFRRRVGVPPRPGFTCHVWLGVEYMRREWGGAETEEERRVEVRTGEERRVE